MVNSQKFQFYRWLMAKAQECLLCCWFEDYDQVSCCVIICWLLIKSVVLCCWLMTNDQLCCLVLCHWVVTKSVVLCLIVLLLMAYDKR